MGLQLDSSENSVMIVAAEASSAFFAQRLIEHWQRKSSSHPISSPQKYFGVGSAAMEALGFERLGKSEEMAVVGIAEVIEHYSHLKAVFNSLVEAAKARRPRVVVIMDYPDFNIKLAGEMKKLGIPVVYYITPQVWAWRQGRAQKIKKYCDQVFVLFPFEKDFFSGLGVKSEFVGHPMLDEMDPKYLDQKYIDLQRSKMGIGPEDILIGLMPGSRRSEITQHIQTQIEVAKKLLRADPRVKILFLCAPTLDKEYFLSFLEDVRFPYMLLKKDPLDMICLVDAMLAASGTATLQVGLLQKPMVVMYKLKWITGLLARLLVHGVKYFCIVNLIFDREVVPERWQSGANADHLFDLLSEYLKNPDHYQKVKSDLAQLQYKLGDRGATGRVAELLGPYFQTGSHQLNSEKTLGVSSIT